MSGVLNLQITVFYTDGKGKLLGYEWERFYRELDEEAYIRATEESLYFHITVPLEENEQMLKVVVYDDTNNKIGSSLVKLP